MKKIIKLVLLMLLTFAMSGCCKDSFEYEACWRHKGSIIVNKYTGNMHFRRGYSNSFNFPPLNS